MCGLLLSYAIREHSERMRLRTWERFGDEVEAYF
jgi:hypothetical protein